MPDATWASRDMLFALYRAAVAVDLASGHWSVKHVESQWQKAIQGMTEALYKAAEEMGVPQDDLTKERLLGYGREILVKEYIPVKQDLETMMAKWGAQVETIMALPQLFIAV